MPATATPKTPDIPFAAFLMRLAKRSVNASQFLFLSHLRQHPDDGPSEIAKALDMTPSGTGEIFKRMRARGFVKKKHATEDERRVIYELTADAIKLLDSVSTPPKPKKRD